MITNENGNGNQVIGRQRTCYWCLEMEHTEGPRVPLTVLPVLQFVLQLTTSAVCSKTDVLDGAAN